MRHNEKKKINLISTYMVKTDVPKANLQAVFGGVCALVLIATVVSLLVLNAETASLNEKTINIMSSLESEEVQREIAYAKDLALKLDRHHAMRTELVGHYETIGSEPRLVSYDVDELIYIANSTSTVTRIYAINYSSASGELELVCQSMSDGDPFEFVKMLRDRIAGGYVTFTDIVYNGSRRDGDVVSFTIKCVLEAKNEG